MSVAPRSKLSREGRDTLWLLGALALSILPHAGHLPLWCALGAAAALAWRARVAWRDDALPPRWMLVVCLIVCVGLTLGTFRTLFGREAGVTLVTLLAALKTLELRARRDAFVITSLGFFLILTQFLYSQSIFIAALMLVVLIGLLTSLVLAQRPTGRPSIQSAVKAAVRSVVMGIPVMVALFVLFPRLGPLWRLPADAAQRTGLSNDIQLGHVANLAMDDSVAMRIRFFQGMPMYRDMYFRGPVLDFFDGRTWHALSSLPGAQRPAIEERVEPHGEPLSYQATLEPLRINAVPLLEGTLAAVPTPPATTPQLRRDGLSWSAGAPMAERTQIDAQVWTGVKYGPPGNGGLQPQWLQLPHGYNPRTLAWVTAFRAEHQLMHARPAELSAALLRHIRFGGYSYTLSVGSEDAVAAKNRSPHLIDTFWLDRKSGFCEHYATAYVYLMRAMGVPSRVVTGYQGGELNTVDGMYVVRNSDAHAWAEIWVAGEGWVRVDPTASVAPERVSQARQVFRYRNPLPGPLSNLDPAMWGRLRSYIDAGNHQWNVWVLQYSRNRQMELLKGWGFDSPNWMDLMRLTGGMLAGLSLLGIAWLWWTRPRLARTPWRGPMMRVHKALHASGFPAPTSSPAPAAASSWIQALDQGPSGERLDELRRQLKDALLQLDALRYGPPSDHDKADAKRARKMLVDRIEQLCQAWRTARKRLPARAP